MSRIFHVVQAPWSVAYDDRRFPVSRGSTGSEGAALRSPVRMRGTSDGGGRLAPSHCRMSAPCSALSVLSSAPFLAWRRIMIIDKNKYIGHLLSNTVFSKRLLLEYTKKALQMLEECKPKPSITQLDSLSSCWSQ